MVIDNEKEVYIIPNINNKKFKDKLKNELEKENSNIKIVISKRIKKLIDFKIKQRIITGKKTLIYMIEEILNYILHIENDFEKRLELEDIYILENNNRFIVYEIIDYFIKKVKSINVITNNINKYKTKEDILYKKGYILTISNNKKKSLKRARIIINFDFTKEEIMKFNINRNAILINVSNEKFENLLGFDGIIINKLQITIGEKLKKYFIENKIFDAFEEDELYESIITNDNFFNQVINIKENEIRLENLIGNNGIINKKEIILNQKLLTNYKN